MRSLNVSMLGNAKAKRGWPPNHIKDDQFNTVYAINDKDNYLIMRWVENSVVTMVSKVHNATDIMKKTQKWARQSNVNK